MPTRTSRTARSRYRDMQIKLNQLKPADPQELFALLSRAFQLRIPQSPVMEEHNSPSDYISRAFFEASESAEDLLVWAARGSGKTYLAAVATLLDLLFKPGIDIRILGGSLEQSSRMFRYLRDLSAHPLALPLLKDKPTQRRLTLANGSSAEILSQSQRSVRGIRPHKLRCDEVEEFDPDIWDAAQLVTRSADLPQGYVHGRIEALSTMHRPFGLMQKLVTDTAVNRTIFRWGILDVIERCPTSRPCKGCPLWEDCQGRAREAAGFVPVEDVVQQRLRSSREVWESEMLCQRPRRSDCVYARFDPTPAGPHVVTQQPTHKETEQGYWIGGMDFGMRSPLVMLWARTWLPADKEDRPEHWQVCVVDEYAGSDRTLAEHEQAMREKGWPMPRWLGVDPAGRQRSSQTGMSDVQWFRQAGYVMRYRQSYLQDGLEMIRRRLDHGTLQIHTRCEKLIRALAEYHFDSSRPRDDRPVKDGPDHYCDALRYMLINLEAGGGPVKTRSYW